MRRNRHWPRLWVVLAAALTWGCGQWSGAPATLASDPAVPLGPGPLVTVAATGRTIGPPAVASARSLVVVAWGQQAEGSPDAVVHAMVSRTAGSTFEPPVRVGRLEGRSSPGVLLVENGVAAPAAMSSAQVWVRARWSDDAASARAWHSTDGGGHFASVPDAWRVPASAFPGAWEPAPAAEATSDAVALLPPPGLRAAGVPRVTRPPRNIGAPAVIVDEHGALALAWREAAGDGTNARLVIRRAWVDWNLPGGHALGFDAAYTMGSLTPRASTPALARVPGGVLVAWFDAPGPGHGNLYVRRLGLDMTCSLESARSPAP